MGWGKELATTDLFRDLDPALNEVLGERAVWRRYRKGSVVFVQGEYGDRCYAIVKGAVKVSAFQADGREAVLALLGPGDVFGELSLFDGDPRSADATAVEDSELLSLDAEGLRNAVLEHPALGLSLLGVLAARLREANLAFQDVSFYDVTGRVARRLADLADRHGAPTDDGALIQIPLSQEGLASMVGATRESVNKALSTLQRKGLVSRMGRNYLVPDAAALRDRAR